ncbi:response regulator transcription factor [Bradyrhizobium amphicarpaeae]|uniref:DNA-binding response regulator n=1 Tax=Bradyrhizobium amphicarpaeae TaxID=1404768 RepID=A0A2U8PLT7_9BRAD|nr:response regulator transcription factor [Bradyrhizobium amphicarpaeae]AWL98711.1 DNA-binding response regulator [Bradyrhizobium amphicarpaeae]
MFVIEREQVVRSALYYILRDLYHTYTFASPDEAFASGLDAPDVVLAGATGLQSQDDPHLIALRERYDGAVILVVADRSSDPMAQLAGEIGIHAIVHKPISFDTVCRAVDCALGGPAPQDATSRLIQLAFD